MLISALTLNVVFTTESEDGQLTSDFMLAEDVTHLDIPTENVSALSDTINQAETRKDEV